MHAERGRGQLLTRSAGPAAEPSGDLVPELDPAPQLRRPSDLGVPMARTLRVASAQLGPIHLADTREAVVARLCSMLREAHGMGAKLVVFSRAGAHHLLPALLVRRHGGDRPLVRARDAERGDRTPVRPGQGPGRRLLPGFTPSSRSSRGVTHRYNTSIIVAPDGQIVGKYRKVHLPGHADHREGIPFQHLEKRYFEVGNLGFPVWRAFDSIVGMMICKRPALARGPTG